ncbi:hypothetical protein NYF20_01385 [Lactobacillus delbrueckii]
MAKKQKGLLALAVILAALLLAFGLYFGNYYHADKTDQQQATAQAVRQYLLAHDK